MISITKELTVETRIRMALKLLIRTGSIGVDALIRPGDHLSIRSIGRTAICSE
jgi:hypothetical protein